MKIERRYLLRRPSGTYYLRFRVPKSMKKVIGLSEITRSLETKDLKIAENHSIFLSKMIKELFHQVEAGMIDKDKVCVILAQNIKSYLVKQEARLASFEHFKDAGDCVDLWKRNAREFNEALITNNFDLADTRFAATCIARKLIPNFTEQDVREIAREVLKSRIKEFELKACLFGTGSYENSPVYKELKQEYLTKPDTRQQPKVIIPEAQPLLKTVIDKYLEEKSPSGDWTPKTQIQVEATMGILKELYGDKTIDSLKRGDFIQLRNEILMKLPARHAMLPKYKGKSISQILKMKNIVPMSTITIQNHLTRIASLFKWAVENGYADRNYATGLQPKTESRPDEQRDVFDKADLEKMLIALSKLKNDEKEFKYWIPLVAIFTGARQTEIAQLYMDNIFIHAGVPSIDISEKHPDQSVKTKSSVRQIPIHPILAQLGFIDFLIGVKKQNAPRPWMHLVARRDGYGQSFQRWFSRFKNDEITTDPKKVFHSLRHTFVNNLKQNGVPEVLIAELVGHSSDSITMSRYGKRYEPKKLLEALDKLDYGIDYFKLLGVEQLSRETVKEQIQELERLLTPDTATSQ